MGESGEGRLIRRAEFNFKYRDPFTGDTKTLTVKVDVLFDKEAEANLRIKVEVSDPDGIFYETEMFNG